MRIAVLAHVRHPIAQPFAGGMEAHAYHLARGLVSRGHDVTLYAAGDSAADVPLRPVLPAAYEATLPWRIHAGTARLNRILDDAFAAILPELRGFDVVHNNTLHRYPPRLARAARVPMVSSLHVPPFDPLSRAIPESGAPWHRVTVTSAAQMRSWFCGAPAWAEVLPNGIDLSAWPFVARGDGGAVWAGRLAANKGPHLAAEAARIADLPLTLYGGVEEADYVAARVAPHLSRTRRLGGHLRAETLAASVGRASVAFFTPLWDEPFGLAALEAMACGVPVAALDRGAAAEVVGWGGVVAPDETAEALAAAARTAMTLDRAAVRRRAEGFGLDGMLDRLEALYDVVRRHRAAPAPAVRFRPQELPSVA